MNSRGITNHWKSVITAVIEMAQEGSRSPREAQLVKV